MRGEAQLLLTLSLGNEMQPLIRVGERQQNRFACKTHKGRDFIADTNTHNKSMVVKFSLSSNHHYSS